MEPTTTHSPHPKRRRRRWSSAALAMALVLSSCGGGKDEAGGGDDRGDTAGTPVRGGSLTYAIDAETGGGYCLPEAQLGGSGIIVARTIYDTLTAPNADGEYVPYLAEAITPNDDATEWTIRLRDGVTFHDGSALTAEVVKNNLDAYRGAPGDHARSPLLFTFVFSDIETVEVSGDLEVTVATKVPWANLPAFLYSSGRVGIMAQSQLDDTTSCNTELVGTGPFQLDGWSEGREFRATKNPDYWQDAPDGEAYPYLDEVVLEPIVEPEQRINALLADDIQMAFFIAAEDILQMREEAESGSVEILESEDDTLVSFWQLNVSRPPFDDVRIRRAMALAVDREEFTESITDGVFAVANGPFGPESPAHLDDTGYPTEVDRAEAERLVAEHEAEAGPLRPVVYQTSPEAPAQELAVYFQQTMAEIGIEVDIEVVQNDVLIDNAISGEFDLMGFVNYPSGDPDELSVWFEGQSPVNFSRFDDPEVDELLAAGRSETDPQTRTQIYQDLNRRLGEQAYSLWTHWIYPQTAASPGVHGFDPETSARLPDGDRIDPSVGAFALHGVWRSDG